MTPSMAFGRPGSTSAQLALILSVLAFIGALFKWVVPGLSDAQRPQKVPQATITLMGRLSGVRVLAMTQGVDYEFLHEPEGSRYLILPAATSKSATEATTSVDGPEPDEVESPRLTGRLPEGTRFAPSDNADRTARTITANRLAGLSNEDELQNVAWAEPIRFTAEGRAMDAVVTIVDNAQNERRILIRGSNGTVRISGR